jgi:cytochrome P450
MTTVAELELPVFDHTDPELKGERFHERMAELRGQGWLASSPLGFFVLEREAGSFFLRSKKTTFPGEKLAEIFGIHEGPLAEEVKRNILHINGPAHARLRSLVATTFTPKAANTWRPRMRSFLEDLWEPLEDASSCEFVEAFAKPYPSLTIAAVMGARRSDAPRLHHWSNWIQRQFDAPSLIADRALIEQAVEEFYEYADELLAEKRESPGDDLISQLIEARDGTDRLSDVELVNLVLNVLVGGVDTTQSQLAHAMRLLAANPEQWEWLREAPEERASRVVDEVLRYEPITPFTARITLEEIEYRDVTFPVDTILMVSAFDGNRDAGTYDAPNTFDVRTERGNAKVMTFGAGIHYCLGANLAKAELEEALIFLAPRLPGLAADGEAVLGSITGIYGLESLPLRWG